MQNKHRTKQEALTTLKDIAVKQDRCIAVMSNEDAGITVITPSGTTVTCTPYGEWCATAKYPAWRQMLVGTHLVRINPELATFPYYRLTDCAALVTERYEEIAHSKDGHTKTLWKLGEQGEVPVVAFRATLEDGNECVIIDTFERMSGWQAS